MRNLDAETRMRIRTLTIVTRMVAIVSMPNAFLFFGLLMFFSHAMGSNTDQSPGCGRKHDRSRLLSFVSCHQFDQTIIVFDLLGGN